VGAANVQMPREGGVGWGIGLVALLHLLQIPLAVVVSVASCLLDPLNLCGLLGIFPVLGIGVSQLLYVVPAVVLAVRRQRPGLAKGIVIGAAATFLLNAACWAMLTLAPM
jgi:hypothetical protein